MNLNPLADPRNEHQNRALFEETIEILQKAWSGEFFSHHGRFYEFPQPDVRWNHPLSPPASGSPMTGSSTRWPSSRAATAPAPAALAGHRLAALIESSAGARDQGHLLAAARLGAEAALRRCTAHRPRPPAARSPRARDLVTGTRRLRGDRRWSRPAAEFEPALIRPTSGSCTGAACQPDGGRRGARPQHALDFDFLTTATCWSARRTMSRADRRAAGRARPGAPADLDDPPRPAASPGDAEPRAVLRRRHAGVLGRRGPPVSPSANPSGGPSLPHSVNPIRRIVTSCEEISSEPGSPARLPYVGAPRPPRYATPGPARPR